MPPKMAGNALVTRKGARAAFIQIPIHAPSESDDAVVFMILTPQNF
jgi:hypothetical protein